MVTSQQPAAILSLGAAIFDAVPIADKCLVLPGPVCLNDLLLRLRCRLVARSGGMVWVDAWPQQYHTATSSLHLESIPVLWYELRMNASNEHLDYQVVVHEVTAGPLPFRWEVFSANRMDPVYVSPNHFDGMEAAYEAGRVWLADFLQRQTEQRVGTRHSGETLVPSLAAPTNGQGDAIDRGRGSAGETLIGTALPVYPSSIG